MGAPIHSNSRMARASTGHWALPSIPASLAFLTDHRASSRVDARNVHAPEPWSKLFKWGLHGGYSIWDPKECKT